MVRALACLFLALPAACVATPSTPSAATLGASSDADAAAPAPDLCTAAKRGELQEITRGAHAPYFVHHPDEGVARPDTIVFVPGGPGSRETAKATFELWLSRGSTLGNYRVIVPYAADGNLTDEGSRIVPVLDEVLGCYGGSAARVHLAGTSNGGRAAYALMLASHDRFLTLLGAPGLFDAQATDSELTIALAGKPIFNAVGGNDTGWLPRVKASHERLLGLGLASEYLEMPNQGHILSASADQEPFFEFWKRHASPAASTH